MRTIKIDSYPAPPEHLSERSQGLWRELGPKYVETAGRRAMFQCALEALDRLDEARRIVDAEGMVSTTTSTGAVHVHPAVKIEREQRQLFAKLWDGLGLQSSCHINF